MSMDMNASASASVSADGSASASASGGIGGSLAGALGGSVGAGLAVAGGLALSAAASMSANLSFSAGASASFGASTATPGVRPPDIYPLFKFIVQLQGMGPVRFQTIGPMHAKEIPPTPAPGPQSGSGNHNAPAGSNNAANTHGGTTAASTTHVPQGGAGGGTVQLTSSAWKWDDLVLTRGLAKDGIAMMLWIQKWMTGDHSDKRNLTVIMLDEEGMPAMTWNYKKTFPREWGIGNFDAKSPGTLAIETLKLGFDGNPDLIIS